MREFFRGWKNKVGLVTLVMACVFMVGWVRSQSIADSLVYATGRDSGSLITSLNCYTVTSADCSLIVGVVIVRSNVAAVINDIESSYRYPKWEIDKKISGYRSEGVHFYWSHFGFRFFELPADENGKRGWRFLIPYWFVTVPLTLISLWLLLSKPLKSNQKRIDEPIPTEGT